MREDNQLHYGDNLSVLRSSIASASVDLIYLDPPFNSNATYNILFKSPTGRQAEAQIEAFEDTWHWNETAEEAFDQVRRSGHTKAFDLLDAVRAFLGENDMMAYLAMMAVRLIALHRVLKPSGSLYLHCDPTASHYLKLLLDGVFGADQFRSEVIWTRTSAHNSARRWGPIHDVILFYTRSGDYRWNRVDLPYDDEYVRRHYRHADASGRRYRLSDLTGSGVRGGESGRAWGGFDPTAHGCHWGIPSVVKAEFGTGATTPHGWLDLFRERGLIDMGSRDGGWPHVRRFLDRMPGMAAQDIVADIPPLSKRHAERLGYPTQKLGRRWIGIDVTHLAISLIEKRMQAAFPAARFTVEGTPKDLESAEDLARRDKYQFQWWAGSLVDAMPAGGRRKGADGGIDGIIYF